MFFSEDTDSFHNTKPLSEINIIPLVDVMLVLLVLFIITAPLLTPSAVNIDLPEVNSEVRPNHLHSVSVAIDKTGQLFWEEERIEEKELVLRLKKLSTQQPPPELHLRVDKMTPYQRLAKVMAEAQRAGVTRLGFIMDNE
jgi:biopolymer transport protein ExbD